MGYSKIIKNNNYRIFCYILENMLKRIVYYEEFIKYLLYQKFEFIDKLIIHYDIDTDISNQGSRLYINKIDKLPDPVIDYVLSLHNSSKITLHPNFISRYLNKKENKDEGKK
jgi:hypothetical protein